MVGPSTASLIASGVLASLVLPICVFRLWIRFSMQRVGWDDTWAAVAFLCGTMTVISNWVYVIKSGEGELATISIWAYMFVFTTMLWAVRVSIMFSIIRFIPSRARFHICGLTIVALFLLCCLAFLVAQVVDCTIASHAFRPTRSNPSFRCSPSQAMNISMFIVGVLADVTAIIFPLCVLRKMTLPARQHRLLRLLFSTSLVMSVLCALRAASGFVPSFTDWSDAIDNFQIGACLMVCNMVVIVTYLYRVLGCQSHDLTADTTEDITVGDSHGLATPNGSLSRRMTLTTVELLFSTPSRESVSVASDGTSPKTVSAAGP